MEKILVLVADQGIYEDHISSVVYVGTDMAQLLAAKEEWNVTDSPYDFTIQTWENGKMILSVIIESNY